jgi:hypothetical protein
MDQLVADWGSTNLGIFRTNSLPSDGVKQGIVHANFAVGVDSNLVLGEMIPIAWQPNNWMSIFVLEQVQ